MSQCPTCKQEMKPLFNGEYCPDAELGKYVCDPVKFEQKTKAEAEKKMAQFSKSYPGFSWAMSGVPKNCPDCGSHNIGKFNPTSWHCWACGHVF